MKMFSQRGVSLVTVLMFMLVATIAATATFKWLNSEGRSSASRMMLNEARQAAVAGITAARTWMTYHGNETGAIIRQFNGNGHKPIRMNNVLGENIDSDKQKFDVWLVGAETETSPYIVKILSTGESKNGTKHSEVAIMKVSGLYQVKVPEKKVSISFDRAFFGKTTGITGDDSLESAIINGNFGQQNNVPKITKPLMVTGDFFFQGSSEMGNDLYIGGNFENRGSLFFGNVETNPSSNDYANCKTSDADTIVVYIGGSIVSCDGGIVAVCGDLYVGGSVPPNCDIKVGGNFTVNGHMERGTSDISKGIGVKKNMVFTDKASWTKNEKNYNPSTGGGTVSTFKVTNNLVLPPTMNGVMDLQDNYSINLNGKVMSYTTANTVLLAQNAPQKKYGVYVEGTSAEKAKAADRHGYRYFSFNADQGIENRKVSKWSESDPLLKKLGDNYWGKLQKMYRYQGLIGSDGEVPVPILLNNEDNWTAKTQNAFCKLGTTFNMNDANIEKINDCYSRASEKELYNGFLILEWHSSEKVDPTKKLDGKFVFYAPDKLASGHELLLPPTTENSVVLLYLKEGAGTLRGTGSVANYFIYSRGDIEQLMGVKVDGCVIMDNGSTLLKYQGHNNLKYKAEVVEAVQAAGLIIGNEEFEKLANKSFGGTSTSGSSEMSDSVYVAVASQLKITMESQYKNEESYGNSDENVKPSILILPRIIYLPKDAKGALSDYYNVVNLNGANERKNPNNVSCNPTGLPTIEKFKLYGTKLPQDVYSCNYMSNNYEKMGFFVVVSGSTADEPVVKFEKKSIEITKGSTVHVNLKSSKSKPAVVDVYQSQAPEGWVVSGATVKKTNVDGSVVYSMPFSGDKLAFDVTMNETASGVGSVYFQLVEPCENCIIKADSNSTTVTAEGSFTLYRNEIENYCNMDAHKDDESCKQGGELYKKIQAPDCGSLTKEGTQWVTADGVGCRMDELNDKWFCSIYITTPVVLKKAENFNDNFCEVVIPPNTSITSAKNDAEYLYASLKRKQYNLHIEFNGAEDTRNKVEVYFKKDSTDERHLKYTCYNGEICDYPISAGFIYELQVGENQGSDRFTHWSSVSNNDIVPEGGKLTLFASTDYSVIANYNDRDEHCFYEDFAPDENNNGFTAFCNNEEDFPRCIDVCYTNPGPGASCKISDAKHWSGGDNSVNPDWVMVYDNRHASSSNCRWDYSSCNCSSTDYKACRLQCRKRICTTVKEGELLPPSISNNFIAANAMADASSEMPNGSQSVILNTKENGSNGSLTSIFSTAIVDVNTTLKDFSNSGFIFRSNDDASEYYSLSVYGKHAGGAYSPYVYVKLCYVNGQTSSDDDDACVEKFLSTTDWDVSEVGGFTNLSKIGLVMNIQSNMVTVNLQLNGNSIKASSTGFSFDLSELFGPMLLLNDIRHGHSGFKLSNKDFKLYDISWSSTAYGDNACWEVPKLVCSFKTNYLGGIIPQDENVKPWVGFSSFTMNKYKKCHIKYYYNGCDNDVSSVSGSQSPLYGWDRLLQLYACASGEKIGMYWDRGGEVHDPFYRFKTSGKHGYYFEDPESSWGGFAMDAKVALECPPDARVEVTSSLLQTQSCGEFYVGDILMCSNNVDFLNSDEPVFCADSCSYEVSGRDGVNVRKSKLLVGLNNPNSHNVRISFTDKNNISSSIYTTAMDGSLSIDVNSISNEDGFDPQHVMRVNVKVVDGSSIEINQLKSSCPNALSIGSCKVQYDNVNWEITADVKNADRCTVEKPIESEAEAVAPGDGCPKTFRLKEKGLYSKSDSELSYEFKIKAYKGTGTEEEMEELTCEPYKIIPIDVDCEIAESQKTVKQGAGVPSLNLSFVNCPEDGCDYTISFDGGVIARGNTQKQGDSEEPYTFSDLNTPANMLSAGEHVFTVISGGKENRNCKITVEETMGKAQASDCKFDENSKVFTAKVDVEQGLTWSGEISLLDYSAIPYKTVQSYVDEVSSEIRVDMSETAFMNGMNTISLTLNGGKAGNKGCSVTYTQKAPQNELELKCPSILTIDGYEKTFEMTPTVKGCENGGCSWQVSGGATVSPSSGYASGALTVTESFVTGSREYTFTLSHEGLESKYCDVIVERASQFELDCAIATQTGVDPGETVTIQPHSVTGCNSDCSYNIEMSAGSGSYIDVINGSGYNYAGGPISFKGASSGGTKQYRLTVTDAMNSSKTCLFEVGYSNSGCSTIERRIPISNGNLALNDVFEAGCHQIKTGKQCSWAQIQSSACSCSDGRSWHTFTINGKTIDCGNYFDSEIPASSTLTLEIPDNCTINGNINLSRCDYDPNYVGVGTKLSSTFQNFSPGQNNVYVAAFDSGNKLNCSVSQTATYNRTVASVNGCNITIAAYNGRSYSNCELNGNEDYVLRVNDDAPSDLMCGLSW